MTHFGLLLADTISILLMTHDPYSWPTNDLFLLSVRPTLSDNIHFLYQLDSIFGSLVGFLQSFGWSVRITYPKPSTIYSLVGSHCIP